MENIQTLIISSVVFSAVTGTILTIKAFLADKKRLQTLKREQPEIDTWAKKKGWMVEKNVHNSDLWSIYSPSWIIQYDWRLGGITFQALSSGPEWVIAPSQEKPLSNVQKQIWAGTQRAVAIATLQSTHLIASATSINDEDAGITAPLKEIIGQGYNPKSLRVWRIQDTFFMILREATPTLANLQWFEKLGQVWTNALPPALKLEN